MSSNNDALQKEAVENAKAAFAKLPHGDDLFQKCVGDQVSIESVLATLREKMGSHKRKRSTKVLDTFDRYTSWMMNISRSIDGAVQSVGGFACPVWASVKFVLIISQENTTATEKILEVIRTVAENMPRLDLYSQFNDEPQFQLALVNLFTDITEFSVKAYRHLARKTFVRLGRFIGRTFEHDFGELVSDIDRRTRNVDGLATALHQKRMERHVNESQAQSRHNDRVRALQRLQPANMREHHERNIASIADHTCEWVLSDPSFRCWISGAGTTVDEKLLVIHGRAGCGKSVLGSYIHDMLEAASGKHETGDQDSNGTTPRSLALLFSFSSADTTRRTNASLAQTLLAQVFELDHDYLLHTHTARLMEKSSLSTSDLMEALGQAIEIIAKPVTIVIDGIDECSDPPDELFRQVNGILAKDLNLKILLLGQSHCFSKVLASWNNTPVISIVPELIHDDIQAVIKAGMNPDATFWDQSTSEEIMDCLLSKADGMFLWVRLMLDYLKTAASTAEVRSSLADLPDGLEQAYCLLLGRLWTRISKNERKLVKRVFSLLVTCARPLDLHELQLAYALSLDIDTKASKQKATGNFLLRLPPDEVVRLCGGFITFVDNRFHVVHNSAREFLTSPVETLATNEKPPWESLLVESQVSHDMLATICQKVFLDGDKGPLDRAPLTNYACLYAAYHLTRSGKGGAQFHSSFRRLLQSSHYLRVFEELASDGTADPAVQLLWESLENPDDLGSSDNESSSIFPGLESGLESGQDPLFALLSMIGTGPQADPDSGIGGFHDPTTINETGSHPPEQPARQQPRSRPLETAIEGPRSLEAEGVNRAADNVAVANQRVAGVINGISSRWHLRRHSTWNNSMLPGGHLDHFLVLARRLYLIKPILDPFTILWDRILRAIDSMSPLLMSGITWYCLSLNKHNEALKIGEECAKKLQNTDTLVRIMHDVIMHNVYASHGNWPKTIECMISARDAMMKPGRKFLRDTFSDIMTIELAEFYLLDKQHHEVLALLEPLYDSGLKVHDNDNKRRLLHTLGNCHYQLEEPEKALTYYREYSKLYTSEKEFAKVTWSDHKGRSFARTQFKIAHCLFELQRDTEALSTFSQLENLYEDQQSSLSEENKTGFKELLDLSKPFKSIISWDQSASGRELKDIIRDQYWLEGRGACQARLWDHSDASQTIFNSINWNRKRAVDSFIEFCNAYEAAIVCKGQKFLCPANARHAWHMSQIYFESATIHYRNSDSAKAARTLFTCLEVYEKHNIILDGQSEELMWRIVELGATVYNLSLFLQYAGNLSDAAYAARIASHFAFFNAKDPLLADEDTRTRDRNRVILTYKAMWELPIFSNVPRDASLANSESDRELLRRFHRYHFSKAEMKELYSGLEALLLPESWNVVQSKYVHYRERKKLSEEWV